MKTPIGLSLLATCLLAAPAFAQITTIPMPPAPLPTATDTATNAGAPVTPLTSADALFVTVTLQGNLGELKAAQIALQNSDDRNVRNFAQKMITDHSGANATLMPIASRHSISGPASLTPADQATLDRLSTLRGLRFDHDYIEMMIAAHEAMLTGMNKQLADGQSQEINAWVQNTRPTVMQHVEIAKQIEFNLPRTG